MKTHRAGRGEQQQRRDEYLQQAKAMKIQMRLLMGFILDQKKSPPRRHGGTEKSQSPYRGFARMIADQGKTKR